MVYKIVDLFAGAGGLSLGFSQTNRFSIVAAAENNPNARKTYKRNHKVSRLYSDVRTIDYNELKDSCGEIDVVIGGPPCQGFSNANRQHTSIISMNNRLVKEYVRAVCELHPKAFVMENVAMLRSNIHRFMVEAEDIANPVVMNLPLSEDKIELLPKSVDFPEAIDFAQNRANIEKYAWTEAVYKIINGLYRFRINKAKFDGCIERYRKNLKNLLIHMIETADASFVHSKEAAMAELLLDYMDEGNIDFTVLIQAIEIPLMIQRMISKMQELAENNIHVHDYRIDSGAVLAIVRSYAVFDYVSGVLTNAPYNYVINSKVYNAADYGAPQRRERFIIVGTRNGMVYEPPAAEYDIHTFRTVKDAIEDLQDIPVTTDVASAPVELPRPDHISDLGKVLRGKLLYNHVSTATGEVAQARFEALKEGQNFHDLDAELKTTYSNAERTQNTIYMRLRYNEPSGTVVNVRKSMWIHPELDRAVSIREAARLQTFPDSFVFEGSKDSQYQQVGNAVPPFLSNAIAKALVSALDAYEE